MTENGEDCKHYFFTLVHFFGLICQIRPFVFLIYSAVWLKFGRSVFYLFGRLDKWVKRKSIGHEKPRPLLLAYWTSSVGMSSSKGALRLQEPYPCLPSQCYHCLLNQNYCPKLKQALHVVDPKLVRNVPFCLKN